MTRYSLARHAVAFGLVSTLAPSAYAQVIVRAGVSPAAAGTPMLARAAGPSLPASLISDIADRAIARELDQREYPDLPQRSAEEVIRTFCGTVTDAHRTAYRRENDLPEGASLTVPLGPNAYKLHWPACLYVTAGPTRVAVESGNSLSDLYLKMTGKVGNRKTILEFFGRRSTIVQPGDQVVGQYYSLPSELVAKAGHDLAALLISPAAAAIPIPPPRHRPGEIIVARSSGASGQPYVRPAECALAGDFSISPAALSFAFSLSEDAGHNRNTVSVLVADNGFYGAATSNGKLSFRGHFDRRIFQVSQGPDGADSIGPQVDVGTGSLLTPVLDGADVPHLDEVSGHGTHVTGLILGGTALGLESGIFDIPTAPGAAKVSWLSLSEYPLSAGTQLVSALAFKSMTQINLANADIVNMSVRYGADIASAMPSLLSLHPDTLFVAAAGNDSEYVASRNHQLESSHPAADGGPMHPNVISVAAEDGAGYLTSFTNFGNKEVDIAATGCNLRSWLDGTQSTSLSGTYQAAPLVTMTSALLARRGLKAGAIKRRILLSGDLLKGKWRTDPDGRPLVANFSDGDRTEIASRSSLNIVKALYFPFDYIDFEAVPPGTPAGSRKIRYRVLGEIHFEGTAQCGGDENDASSLLAAKRAGNILWCFENGPFQAAQGSFGTDVMVTITVAHFLKPDGTEDKTNTGPIRFNPSPADIHEFILSEPNMTFIQGQ